MYKKRKPFFSNKKCTYCSKQATAFRLINGRHEMLCGRKECDIKSRIKAGWFGLNLSKER